MNTDKTQCGDCRIFFNRDAIGEHYQLCPMFKNRFKMLFDTLCNYRHQATTQNWNQVQMKCFKDFLGTFVSDLEVELGFDVPVEP